MNTYIAELKDRFTGDLVRSAREFLDIGIDLFYCHLNSERSCVQSAMNIMSTGIELTLKAFIADKNLSLIFKDIPADVRVFLSCPESVPHFFQWRGFEPDIRSDTYETIDLTECLACLYIFFPHVKQLIMPHVKFLARWGHFSSHTVLSHVEMYDLERTGYAVFQILSLLDTEKASRLVFYSLTDRDKKFMEDFETKRVERVNLAIVQARSDMFESDGTGVMAIIAQDCETYVTPCPVCKYNGYLAGYTEIAIGRDEEGPKPALDFFATTFECDVCGLRLNDIEELKLANMALLYDRSDDLDRWFHEHRDDAEWMMG